MPQMLGEIGLFILGKTCLGFLHGQIGRLLVRRLDRPVQAVLRAAEIEVRALAEFLDFVAQVDFEITPHRGQAELAERFLGLLDCVARQREGGEMLALVGIDPTIGQQLIAAP